MPALDASHHRYAQTQGGVEVRAEPVLESERAEQYFGFDAPGEGVVPIVLEFRSADSERSLRIAPEWISFGDATEPSPANAHDRRTGSSLEAVTTLLVFVPVIGVAAVVAQAASHAVAVQQRSDVTVVRHQLEVTQLRAHTLSPGETERGVVFFAARPGVPRPAEATLVVVVGDMAGHPVHRFEFRIPLT